MVSLSSLQAPLQTVWHITCQSSRMDKCLIAATVCELITFEKQPSHGLTSENKLTIRTIPKLAEQCFATAYLLSRPIPSFDNLSLFCTDAIIQALILPKLGQGIIGSLCRVGLLMQSTNKKPKEIIQFKNDIITCLTNTNFALTFFYLMPLPKNVLLSGISFLPHKWQSKLRCNVLSKVSCFKAMGFTILASFHAIRTFQYMMQLPPPQENNDGQS